MISVRGLLARNRQTKFQNNLKLQKLQQKISEISKGIGWIELFVKNKTKQNGTNDKFGREKKKENLLSLSVIILILEID